MDLSIMMIGICKYMDGWGVEIYYNKVKIDVIMLPYQQEYINVAELLMIEVVLDIGKEQWQHLVN